MPFQSTVFINQGAGVPGEFFANVPHKAESFTIDSDNSALNIIGQTCCSVTAQGFCAAGAPAGNLGFAGFLANPKDTVLFGQVGAPLAASMIAPDNSLVTCVTMGSLIVRLPAAATIGSYVVFNNNTGAISTIAVDDPLPADHTFANAIVDYFVPDAVGSQLAVIAISPTYVIPQPA